MPTPIAEPKVRLEPPRLDVLPPVKELPKVRVPVPAPLSVGLLLLRVGIGSLFFTHGLSRIVHFDATLEELSRSLPLGLPPVVSASAAVFAEFFCSALVTVGVVTRAAVLPLLAMMGVSLFLRRGAGLEEMERSLSYGICYLALLFTGPGELSIDGVLARLRKPPA